MSSKRGLSPIIATSLLILISVILAAVIFLWVRSFLVEKVTKDLGGGGAGQPIESFCPDVGFSADVALISATNLAVNVVNNKDVPIYAVDIMKKGIGSTKSVCIATSQSNGLGSGDSQSLACDSQFASGSVNSGDVVIVVPVLLGTAGGADKAYTCDQRYGVQATVTQS